MLASHSLNVDSLAAGLTDGQHRALDAVRDRARRSGVAVYLVGGPVRDMLLSEPVLDLDFSVEGDAIAFAREVSIRLDGDVTAHSRFGTATISISPPSIPHPGGEPLAGRVDFATARTESYRTPGQLPDVQPAGIAEDLARRDFSINAMALPVALESGTLLDLHGGVHDLEAGVIRVLHPHSFFDDPTRMLRAVRYEQRFGFRLEGETHRLLSKAVSAGVMDSVSGARWQAELERVFREENPVAPLRRSAELGLLRGLHPALGKLTLDSPEFCRLDCKRQRGERLTDAECLAGLLCRLDSVEAELVIDRLHFPRRWTTIARDTIGLREAEEHIRAEAGSPSRMIRLLAGWSPDAVNAWTTLTSDEVVAETLERYLHEWRVVKPELSGEDLLEMGTAPGPMVGELLAKLRDARLDGSVKSIECERSLALELLATNGVEATG